MLEKINDQKERFLSSRLIIQKAFIANKMRAVKCGEKEVGCQVKTMDGSFVVTPEDINRMPEIERAVFEDIFDELLQEIYAEEQQKKLGLL